MRERPGKRDQAILADAMHYRLTTNEFVRERFLPDSTENATTKVTSRLVRDGWLSSHTLVDKRLYFTPGSLCVKQFGVPPSRLRPLGVQALATSLSIASYCLDPGRQGQLLGSKLFENAWSWIPVKLRSRPYTVDAVEGVPTLKIIRVDLGGNPEHVANKCVHDLKVRCDIPGFKSLLSQRRFVLVVLTTTESKKQLIMRSLQKRTWPNNTRFEIVEISDLCKLLSS